MSVTRRHFLYTSALALGAAALPAGAKPNAGIRSRRSGALRHHGRRTGAGAGGPAAKNSSFTRQHRGPGA